MFEGYGRPSHHSSFGRRPMDTRHSPAHSLAVVVEVEGDTNYATKTY